MAVASPSPAHTYFALYRQWLMVVTWNRCFSWYLLAVFAVLYFVGKNNLAVTPFGFISELLCLLCYGTVCLLDFVFLEYFSLTLLFFSSFRMSLGLIHAWQVLHYWTIPPACSVPLSSLCYVTCLDFQKKYGEILITEFLE